MNVQSGMQYNAIYSSRKIAERSLNQLERDCEKVSRSAREKNAEIPEKDGERTCYQSSNERIMSTKNYTYCYSGASKLYYHMILISMSREILSPLIARYPFFQNG